MKHTRSILYTFCLLSVLALFSMLVLALGQASAAPLKFKVTLIGTHDIDWTFHLRENTNPGGFTSDLLQEGVEFINYDSIKPVTMIFKKKPGLGLVGTVKGSGIAGFPQVKVDITNDNVVSYSCVGNCPPPPDQNILRSGCGSSLDSGNVKLTYEAGTFSVQSMRFSDLAGLPGGTALPPGFDPSLFYLPVGVLLAQNCGPTFPPNNPAQDLVDFRYPFLVDSNSDLLPGKPSTAVDKKLKNVQIGKTLVVNFDFAVSPNKVLLFNGNGYTYEGVTGVTWKLKLKRIS